MEEAWHLAVCSGQHVLDSFRCLLAFVVLQMSSFTLYVNLRSCQHLVQTCVKVCMSGLFPPPSVALFTIGPNSDLSLTRLMIFHTTLLDVLRLFLLGGVLSDI